VAHGGRRRAERLLTRAAAPAPGRGPDGAGPGSPVLERIALEVWYVSGSNRRTFSLEGFRRAPLQPEEAQPAS